MVKILIVEDKFAFEVEDVLKYLKEKKLKFEITLCSNTINSIRYLRYNFDKIDLIIFNFGNYREKGEKVKLNTEGFNLIQEIDSLTKMKNKKNLSIIINSSTKLELPNTITEEKYFSNLKAKCGITINHTDKIDGLYVYEFIDKNMAEKIEFQ